MITIWKRNPKPRKHVASPEPATSTGPAAPAAKPGKPAQRAPRERSEVPTLEASRTLKALRVVALALITALVVVATTVAFIESYEGLYQWALDHGLRGVWARVWPLQVDAFIAVGELSLFIAIVDRWESYRFPWIVTAVGLGFSVWGNVGHVTVTALSFKATAAVPPLAAAAGLMVGLQVLKRIVAARDTHPAAPVADVHPADNQTGELHAVNAPVSTGPADTEPELVRPKRTPVKTSTRKKTAGKAGQVRRRSATAPPAVDDLLPLGWRIAADLQARGESLTRDRLQAAIRESGQSISTDRARALLARLRTEAPAEPAAIADRTSDQITKRDATPTRQSPAAPRTPAHSNAHEVKSS